MRHNLDQAGRNGCKGRHDIALKRAARHIFEALVDSDRVTGAALQLSRLERVNRGVEPFAFTVCGGRKRDRAGLLCHVFGSAERDHRAREDNSNCRCRFNVFRIVGGQNLRNP